MTQFEKDLATVITRHIRNEDLASFNLVLADCLKDCVKAFQRASSRLARCQACGKVFARQRARFHKPANGIFCSSPACQSWAKIDRTQRSRQRIVGQWLDTAAHAWHQVGAIQSAAPSELEWIAEQVNQAHHTQFGRRWVSQHKNQIQELAGEMRPE